MRDEGKTRYYKKQGSEKDLDIAEALLDTVLELKRQTESARRCARYPLTQRVANRIKRTIEKKKSIMGLGETGVIEELRATITALKLEQSVPRPESEIRIKEDR